MSTLVYLLLFLLPFLVLPFGISPFETPKVYVAELGMIALILWCIAAYSFASFKKKVYLPIVLLGILALLHLFISPSDTVLFGNTFRLYGTFIFLLLLIFSILSSRIAVTIPSPKILLVFMLVQLLLACIIQGKIDYRAIGTLGEANSLAASALVLCGFLVFSENKKKTMQNKILLGVGTLCTVLTIVFSGSRSGCIAFVVGIVFYFIQRYSLMAAVIISSSVMLLATAFPFLQQNQLFENRATVWETAVTAGFERPLFGWGVGNTEVALQNGARTLQNVIRFEYVDHAHNIFLEYFVELGIIGLSILIWLLITVVRNSVQKNDRLTLILLLVLMTMLWFNPLSIVLLIQFWWVVGRGLSSEKNKSKA